MLSCTWPPRLARQMDEKHQTSFARRVDFPEETLRASVLSTRTDAGVFNPWRPRSSVPRIARACWRGARGLFLVSVSTPAAGDGREPRPTVPLGAGSRTGPRGCILLPWHHPRLQRSRPAAKSRSGEQQPVHGSGEESSTPLIKAGSDFKQMCTARLLLALLCAAARLGQFIGAASSALVGSICAAFVRWLV